MLLQISNEKKKNYLKTVFLQKMCYTVYYTEYPDFLIGFLLSWLQLARSWIRGGPEYSIFVLKLEQQPEQAQAMTESMDTAKWMNLLDALRKKVAIHTLPTKNQNFRL